MHSRLGAGAANFLEQNLDNSGLATVNILTSLVNCHTPKAGSGADMRRARQLAVFATSIETQTHLTDVREACNHTPQSAGRLVVDDKRKEAKEGDRLRRLSVQSLTPCSRMITNLNP